MAIIRPAPPPDVLAAFTSGLPAFLYKPQGVVSEGYIQDAPSLPTPADLGPLPYQAAIQVFVLSLQSAATIGAAAAAVPGGWRLFAGVTPGKMLMGRVARKGSLPWRLTAVYYGEHVSPALRQSQSLDAMPQAALADYELRMLLVPGLQLEAYWLMSQTQGTPDLVVPSPAGPDQQNRTLPEASYTMPNFVATIRPLAMLPGRPGTGA